MSMQSVSRPHDRGQVAHDILDAFAKAQAYLYSGGTVPQPRTELHTEDGLVGRDRGKLALYAGANCLKRHINDIVGREVVSTNEAVGVMTLALQAWFRELDHNRSTR